MAAAERDWPRLLVGLMAAAGYCLWPRCPHGRQLYCLSLVAWVPTSMAPAPSDPRVHGSMHGRMASSRHSHVSHDISRIYCSFLGVWFIRYNYLRYLSNVFIGKISFKAAPIWDEESWSRLKNCGSGYGETQPTDETLVLYEMCCFFFNYNRIIIFICSIKWI